MGVTEIIDEAQIEEQRKKRFSKIEGYMDKFEKQFEDFDRMPIKESRANRKLTPEDFAFLGEMLEAQELHWRAERQKAQIFEFGSAPDHGEPPTFIYDVLTALLGANIINKFCGQQKLEGSQGLIKFEDIVAKSTRGNVTTGDKLRSSTSVADTYAFAYAHQLVEDEAFFTTAAAQTTYNKTLDFKPIIPGSLRVKRDDDATAKIKDDTDGEILSNDGTEGTVDHETGDLSVTLDTYPGDGVVFTVTYEHNGEDSGDVAFIQSIFRQQFVQARKWMLVAKDGVFQNFEAKDILGIDTDARIKKILVQELINQIGTRIVKLYENNVPASGLTFDPTAGTGEPHFKRQDLAFKLRAAFQKIRKQAGRGRGNFILAGDNMLVYMDYLTGFKASKVRDIDGIYEYGTYDGRSVMACPQIDPNKLIVGYKGETPHTAPAIHGTYMPITVIAAGDPDNIYQNRPGVAHWGSATMVVKEFLTEITLNNSEV